MGRRLAAEFFGTALLLLAVAGSGVMGESLAFGNVAVALLANSLATGAALYVILRMLQVSAKPRSSAGLLVSELIATVILLLLVRTASSRKDDGLPAYLGLTVMAGYWATASTFFVNPAATLARSLTNTFVGIRPADVGPFVLAQLAALVLALLALRLIRR